MAHRLLHAVARAAPDQRVADRQEMFAGDDQPRFGQQEMHVGDAAVQRVFDRDDHTVGLPRLHRIQRVLEAEARQRQRAGKRLRHRDMAVGAGRALERDGAFGDLSALQAELVQALAGREIDVAIAPELAPHPDIWPMAELAYTDSYTAFAAARHPLAGAKEVPLSAALGQRWTMPEIGSTPRMLFHRLVTAQGEALPDVAVETGSIGTMLATVAASSLLG
ncbi:hypothetical protein LTR94_029801, partial [Friedmanniomyces endolithicus]